MAAKNGVKGPERLRALLQDSSDQPPPLESPTSICPACQRDVPHSVRQLSILGGSVFLTSVCSASIHPSIHSPIRPRDLLCSLSQNLQLHRIRCPGPPQQQQHQPGPRAEWMIEERPRTPEVIVIDSDSGDGDSSYDEDEAGELFLFWC